MPNRKFIGSGAFDAERLTGLRAGCDAVADSPQAWDVSEVLFHGLHDVFAHTARGVAISPRLLSWSEDLAEAIILQASRVAGENPTGTITTSNPRYVQEIFRLGGELLDREPSDTPSRHGEIAAWLPLLVEGYAVMLDDRCAIELVNYVSAASVWETGLREAEDIIAANPKSIIDK